jgi:lipocalin
MANSLNFTNEPFLKLSGMTSGNTTTATNYTILQSSISHRRLYALGVSTSDNAVNNVQFSLYDGTTTAVIAKLPISISAGTSTTTAVYDVLGSSLIYGIVRERDNTSASFLHIPSGCTVVAQYQSALTLNEFINFTMVGQTY